MTNKQYLSVTGLLETTWLLLSLSIMSSASQPASYMVPNPFSGQNQATINDYFYIKGTQTVSEDSDESELIEEYFSLGLGLTFSVHRDSSGKSEPWAILVDGRQAHSYILHNPDATTEQEIDCELDHLHSHKKLYPWQYVYDVDQAIIRVNYNGSRSEFTSINRNNGQLSMDTTSDSSKSPPTESDSELKGSSSMHRRRDKTKKPKNRASIYGVGAIWLNLIQANVRSTLVGHNSPYNDTNSWQLYKTGLEIEMLFEKGRALNDGHVITQSLLDKTKPVALKVGMDVPHEDSANVHTRRVETRISIERFNSGFKEDDSDKSNPIRKYRIQLELCKLNNKRYHQFPSLMRAIASSRERLYKIDYVTHRFSSYGLGELDGSYVEEYHRFMWPYEFTSEVLSLDHNTQTIIYDPGFMESQSENEFTRRLDLFMARYTEKAMAQAGKHEAAESYYQMMIYDDDKGISCMRGRREPRAKFRLFSRQFTFNTGANNGSSQKRQDRLNGIGALLMNARDIVRHKSLSLFPMEIQVPNNLEDLNRRHTVKVDVWQTLDEHDKVRVLFYFERRNQILEPASWVMAERDRSKLARLVRIDLRAATSMVDDNNGALKVDQTLVDSDDDLLAQYHIFNFEFELQEHEAKAYFELPQECLHSPRLLNQDNDQDGESLGRLELGDLIDYAADNYESSDSDDDNELELSPPKNQLADQVDQYEQLEGLQTSDKPLPDLIELLGDETSYKIFTRIELLIHDDEKSSSDNQPERKAIWLSEVMNLSSEQLLLNVYLSSENLDRYEPDEQFFIFYESELILRINHEGGCSLVDDIKTRWLHLFSGHLNYCLVANRRKTGHNKRLDQDQDHEEGMEDKRELLIESNRLSSYGLGALWRRASQTGLAEFLGARQEKIELNGQMYKRLEWLYEEYDMSMRWTFLLEASSSDQKSEDDKKSAKLQLESVLISNQYDSNEYESTNFKQVKVVVEQFQSGVPAKFDVPFKCQDQLLEAQRILEHNQDVKLPSPEQVLGQTRLHELQYKIYKFQATLSNVRQELATEGPSLVASEGLGGIQVSESFDYKLNRGKMIIEVDANSATKNKIEIFFNGATRQFFIMNEHLAIKCSILTHLWPTLDPMLSMLVTDNPVLDPHRKYGLLGIWQALETKPTKLRVKQWYDLFGGLNEEQEYSLELVEQPEAGKSQPDVKEVRFYFAKNTKQPSRANDATKSSYDHVKKASLRQGRELILDRVELRHIRGRMQHHRDSVNDHVRIIIEAQKDELSDEWSLPEACRQLIDPNTTYHSSSSAPVHGFEFPKLSDLLSRSNRRLHMRSEVIIQDDHLGETSYLVDELYNEGDVRMRTQQFGKATGKERTTCDLLMLANTFDQFDLTLPLKCDRVFETKPNRCLRMSLLDVWLGESDCVGAIETLASLNYGPLALWKLAENGSGKISAVLIRIEGLPSGVWARQGDESVEQFKEQLEDRELDRVVWLIRGINNGKPSKWSYEMKFVRQRKRQVVPEAGRQVVLEAITVHDTTLDGSKLFTVNIEVVNYKEQPPDDGDRIIWTPFRELFRLPEGWNCRRKLIEDTERPFELNLDLNSDVQLGYEASLEILDTSEVRESSRQLNGVKTKPNQVVRGSGVASSSDSGQSPTLVGTYLTGDNFMVAKEILTTAPAGSTSSQAGLELSIHQSMARFSDGTSLNRRIVAYRDRSLEYEMDLVSGACTINRVQNTKWQLRFPATVSGETPIDHTIDLFSVGGRLSESSDRDLFRIMFVDNVDKFGHEQFFLVNQYMKEEEKSAKNKKVLYTSYERHFDRLKLSDQLEGQARVVRRYEQQVIGDDGDSKQMVDNGTWRRVNFITAQVYLLSENEKRLRAILTIRLQVHPPPRLSEFLNLASVSDCFNADQLRQRPLASLTLEYPLRQQWFNRAAISHSIDPQLKDTFYANLLRSSGIRLMPLQLDGRAHLEFARHEQLLRIHFNVLEPPSAMVYFNRRFECTMNERLEALAESRILPDVATCSRWCDQINCLAMSYSHDDRQCLVATRASIFGPEEIARNKSVAERGADLVQLAACSPRSECTYFYYNKFTATPFTLSSFGDYLDRVVNKKIDKEHLESLSLPLSAMRADFDSRHTLIEPTRFYESNGIFSLEPKDQNYDDQYQTKIGGSEPSSARLASSNARIGSSTGGLQVATNSFAVWKSHSQFDANKIPQLNTNLKELDLDSDSKFIINLSVASRLADCMQECKRNNCLLVTWCRHENRCELLSSTGRSNGLAMSPGAFKGESMTINSTQCNIYIRDHLDIFHLFENTQKPAKYWHRLDNYTPQECAAACYLNQAECLAFDMCTNVLDETSEMHQQDQRSICFLQHDHITQDSFDRFILLPAWESDNISSQRRDIIDGHQVNCDHYSKSILAEFRRVPNVEVGAGLGHGSMIRGISADQCAVDCLQDDACRAFEHCQNPNQQPAQSCYLIRSIDDDCINCWLAQNLNDSTNNRVAPVSINTTIESGSINLATEFMTSRWCSIFIAKSGLMSERIEKALQTLDASGGGDGRLQHSSGNSLSLIIICLLITIMLGIALQFACINRSGHALSLRHLGCLTRNY